MATAEVLYDRGVHYAANCKRCGGGMSCNRILHGRQTYTCVGCGTVMYVYRVTISDSVIELTVWAHECPEGMMLGTYVNGLIDQLRPIATG